MTAPVFSMLQTKRKRGPRYRSSLPKRVTLRQTRSVTTLSAVEKSLTFPERVEKDALKSLLPHSCYTDTMTPSRNNFFRPISKADFQLLGDPCQITCLHNICYVVGFFIHSYRMLYDGYFWERTIYSDRYRGD